MSVHARIERHTDRLHRMADRLGVDLEEQQMRGGLGEGGLAAAALDCVACRQTGACDGFLTRAGSDETAPDYCRNKALLERLARGS